MNIDRESQSQQATNFSSQDGQLAVKGQDEVIDPLSSTANRRRPLSSEPDGDGIVNIV